MDSFQSMMSWLVSEWKLLLDWQLPQNLENLNMATKCWLDSSQSFCWKPSWFGCIFPFRYPKTLHSCIFLAMIFVRDLSPKDLQNSSRSLLGNVSVGEVGIPASWRGVSLGAKRVDFSRNPGAFLHPVGYGEMLIFICRWHAYLNWLRKVWSSKTDTNRSEE